jgi:hypothetical protein
MKPEIDAIACILERAGSDNGIVTLNALDVVALGLTDCQEEVEIIVNPSRMQGVVYDAKQSFEPHKDIIQAVEGIVCYDENGDPIIRSYNVHVGTARKALKAKGFTNIANRRMPDRKMPKEEPVSA